MSKYTMVCLAANKSQTHVTRAPETHFFFFFLFPFFLLVQGITSRLAWYFAKEMVSLGSTMIVYYGITQCELFGRYCVHCATDALSSAHPMAVFAGSTELNKKVIRHP